jgi:metal-responsive CopG/Arc/MetJ family transcriptional regulator
MHKKRGPKPRPPTRTFIGLRLHNDLLAQLNDYCATQAVKQSRTVIIENAIRDLLEQSAASGQRTSNTVSVGNDSVPVESP